MVLYNNSCLDITSEHTPDPFITPFNDRFYLTFTGNTRVPMWDASSLLDFYSSPQKGPVYLAPPHGPTSERLWAPELHCLRGRWYIYFAGANAIQGNRSHRMYILGGPPANSDPHQGPWQFLGPIRGMDQRQWAIDGTVFEIDSKLYFCYSGWPEVEGSENKWEDSRENLQQIFIIRLDSPVTAAAKSPPTMIAHPSANWERQGAAINEGPQWLESPTSDWRGIVYSCSASWTKDYKMATLRYLGGDPLSPSSWQKGEQPLLQNRADGQGPYGPGHGCFLHADGETVALFHATDRDTDGNQNRRCRMQKVRWTAKGPDMGGEVGARTGDVEVFLNRHLDVREVGEGREGTSDGLRDLVLGVRDAVKGTRTT